MNARVLYSSPVTARVGFQKGILGGGPRAASADPKTAVKDAIARTFSPSPLNNSTFFTSRRLGSSSARRRPRVLSGADDRVHEGTRLVTGDFLQRGPHACQHPAHDVSKSFHVSASFQSDQSDCRGFADHGNYFHKSSKPGFGHVERPRTS